MLKKNITAWGLCIITVLSLLFSNVFIIKAKAGRSGLYILSSVPISYNDTWDFDDYRTSDIKINSSGNYFIKDSDPSSSEGHGVEIGGSESVVHLFIQTANLETTGFSSDPCIEIKDGATAFILSVETRHL